MAFHFEIIRDGEHFFATADGGAQFRVGTRVTYGGRDMPRTVGLSNGGNEGAGSLYQASDYAKVFPYWADFIEPTAICEGQSFVTLNTYDRAFFTFGFTQFAAHVPLGDFVLWFRDMLALPEAAYYFPDLEIANGAIARQGGAPLETAQSTQALMTYLNPSLQAVEDDEVLAAARFIHWTLNQQSARDLQVRHMAAIAKQKLAEADRRLGLNGKTGTICCIVFDILHQGRAHYSDMQRALLSSTPDAALLECGHIGQPGRCSNLGKALNPGRRETLDLKRWNSATRDFV